MKSESFFKKYSLCCQRLCAFLKKFFEKQGVICNVWPAITLKGKTTGFLSSVMTGGDANMTD